MRRYLGEPLETSARIAVISDDALGNFICVTPLLQSLREEHNGCELHYFGGDRTRELWERDPAIDRGWSACRFGREAWNKSGRLHSSISASFDLVVNVEREVWAGQLARELTSERGAVCGPCLGASGGWMSFPHDAVGALADDVDWNESAKRGRHSIVRSKFIGEYFCRLAYVKGATRRCRVALEQPANPVPDVLISACAGSDCKLLPFQTWLTIVTEMMQSGRSVGVLGAKRQEQYRGSGIEDRLIREAGVLDLRGAWTLPEVAGATRVAQVVVSLDNGVMHLAAAAGAKVVGVFRQSTHPLWAQPDTQLVPIVAEEAVGVEGVEASRILAAIESLD